MKCFGGHGGGGTPGPISNPEVKPSSADGTALETEWESRSLPRLLDERAAREGGPFAFPYADLHVGCLPEEGARRPEGRRAHRRASSCDPGGDPANRTAREGTRRDVAARTGDRAPRSRRPQGGGGGGREGKSPRPSFGGGPGGPRTGHVRAGAMAGGAHGAEGVQAHQRPRRPEPPHRGQPPWARPTGGGRPSGRGGAPGQGRP